MEATSSPHGGVSGKGITFRAASKDSSLPHKGAPPELREDLTSSHCMTRWVMAFSSAMAFSSWKSQGKASVHSFSSCTILAEKVFNMAWRGGLRVSPKPPQ